MAGKAELGMRVTGSRQNIIGQPVGRCDGFSANPAWLLVGGLDGLKTGPADGQLGNVS
jgi:hypothetical protein